MTLLTRTGLRINRYCSMSHFPFFKMAAVRHLGFSKVENFNFRSASEAQCEFVLRLLDHPRRVFDGLCDCAKFGCNRRSNCDSMHILIFCTLSLKMPIHAPKIGFLGILPQNGGAI